MNARTEFADDDVLHEHLATNRYYDRVLKSSAVKILPGEYFVTRQEMVLVTVLGSCISACIRDREKGIGGMNHFMLPEGGKTRADPRDTVASRWKCWSTTCSRWAPGVRSSRQRSSVAEPSCRR